MTKAKKTEGQFIQAIMGDDFAKQIIEELDIGEMPQAFQLEMIMMLGKNVVSRVILEILKALPESEHATFESFMDSGDLDGLRLFLSKYIPDLDAFVKHEGNKEYEGSKTRLHMARQGMAAQN